MNSIPDLLLQPSRQESNSTISALPIESARWIWTDDDPDEEHVWIDARRTFEVIDPAGAWLDITADLHYYFWINGVPVGFGPPKYHSASPTVDRYEVAQWLLPGLNIFTARVYSYGAKGDLSSCMPVRGGLRAVVGVDDRTIPTDSNWQVRRVHAFVAKTARRVGMQPPAELYDARLAVPVPWHPEIRDWQSATELPELATEVQFEPRDIPAFGWSTHRPDRLIETGVAAFTEEVIPEELAPASRQIADAFRLPSRNGAVQRVRGECGNFDRIVLDTSHLTAKDGAYALWDFGRIWAGYPVITLQGEPGTVVDMSYAECLKTGSLDPTKHGLNYTDRIILGEDRLVHRITWPKCFRYLQIDVRAGRATIESIALERSSYPVERKGSFSSSDPVLEAAWEISAHTVELCMADGYMDTPWRERGSWLGDDIPKMLANYSVFGDQALARRFLLHHGRGQLPTGQMRGKYPGSKTSYISTWTLTFPVSVREYLNYSNDTEFAREILPTIEQGLGWMEKFRTAEGVYGNLPLEVTATRCVYNFIDWSPVDTRGANAAWNAHAYNCLRAAASVARFAGDDAKAKRWNSLSESLRLNYLKLFWDEERGIFTNGWHEGKRLEQWGCHENYLAIFVGLADESRRRRILARLEQENLLTVFHSCSDAYDEIIPGHDGNHMVAIALNQYRWDKEKMVPLGTPYFAWFALEALLQLGMAREALALIGQHWGNFLRQGATTTWETWDRDWGSLSHGWGCAPAIVLGKYILGIRSSTLSEFNVEIVPQSGGLTWAAGRVNTPRGVIQSKWQYDEKGWRMDVDIPENCRVLAALPAGSGSLMLDQKKVSAPERIWRHGTEYLAVPVGAGRHLLQTETPLA